MHHTFADLLTFHMAVSMAIGRLEVCTYRFLAQPERPSSNFIALTGVRVSLYNAVTEAHADTLIQFMEKFVSEAGSQASA